MLHTAAKAVEFDRSFRRPKRDEWLCRDDPPQGRTERKYRWAGDDVGQATSTIPPTLAA